MAGSLRNVSVAALTGLPKTEMEGEDFRGKQTNSHHCSELQAGQVFLTIKVMDFSLGFTFLTLPVLYAYLISIRNWTERIFRSWWKIIHDQCEEILLASWTRAVVRVPSAGAELLGRDTPRSSWCTEMLTLVLKILPGKLLRSWKKRQGERREQLSKDLKITGYLPSVFILEREGVRWVIYKTSKMPGVTRIKQTFETIYFMTPYDSQTFISGHFYKVSLAELV